MTGGQRELFERALEIGEEQRADWLAANCADPARRAAIEHLLKLDGSAAASGFERGFDDLLEQIGAVDSVQPLCGTRVGAFVLQELLGEGGSSTVFRAEREQAGVRQQVALKLLRRSLYSEDERRRFRDERRALSQLNHRGIARLVEGGITDAGVPYIALELVEGCTIIEHARANALGLAPSLQLFVEVCHAVEAAHRALIVHRDLKPSNVLVTRDGEVKLLDFGIAKLLDHDDADPDPTRTRQPMLTPAYAAPEQFEGGPITTATDVYALGVLLEELLTGHRRSPGDVHTPSSRLPRKTPVSAPADPSTRVRRQLAGDLDNIVLKATAEEPARRYASAGALAEDIDRYVANEPVSAHPPSRGYRARKFIARHRAGVVTTIAIVIGIGVAIGFMLAQAQVAYRAAARAEAMRGFMFKAFAQAEPSGPRDGAPRITEVVSQAVEKARADTRMNPLARTELVTQLGAVLREQGQVKSAGEILAWNYDQARRTFGEGVPLTVQAGHELALAMIYAGQFTQARPLIDALLKRAGTVDAALAARLHYDAALLATKLHDRQRATDEAAIGMARARVSGSDDALDSALAEQGNVQLEVGDFPGAVATYSELLVRDVRRFGPVHREVASTQASLSRAYRRAGNIAAAEQHIRAALAIDAEVLPKDDWRRANHLNALMFVLMQRRDFAAALDAALEGLRINQLAYGADHPEVANDLNSVGMLRTMLGDYAGARGPLRRSLELSRATWGEASLDAALAHANYGVALANSGDVDKGIAQIRSGIEAYAATAEPDPDQLATLWEKLARAQLDLHDAGAALPAIKRIEVLLGKIDGARPYWDGRVATLRTAAALRQGDIGKARTFALDAAKALKASPAADPELAVEVALLRATAARGAPVASDAAPLASAGLDAIAQLRSPSPRLRALAGTLQQGDPSAD